MLRCTMLQCPSSIPVEELVLNNNQGMDVVVASGGKIDERRNRRAQRQQRVQLDRRFGGAKVRPGKQRQAQTDGGGVQSVDRLLQLQGEGLVAVSLQGARVDPARDTLIAENTPIDYLDFASPVAGP